MIHIECLEIKSVVSTMIFLIRLKEKGVYGHLCVCECHPRYYDILTGLHI